jgi:hypothetical protein
LSATVLTQTGTTVAGTARTTGLNPSDGSCSSCHRYKIGTVSGTISGTALTLTMAFPGNSAETTPACAATFNVMASTIADNAFATTYSGGDTCENPQGQTIAFTNGTLNVARFADDPLTAGSSLIRAVHITELRSRIDALRARFGLPAFSYTDPTLTAGTTISQAQHVIDLRAALTQAYVAAGMTPPTYTDTPLAAGTPIKATHIAELRAALVALE